jgi:hypothetical protein
LPPFAAFLVQCCRPTMNPRRPPTIESRSFRFFLKQSPSQLVF